MIEGAKEEVALSLLKLGVSEYIVAQETGLGVNRIIELKANLKNEIENN